MATDLDYSAPGGSGLPQDPVTVGTAATIVLGTRVSGDTADRLTIAGDGTLSFGPGNGAADSTISRLGGGAGIYINAATTQVKGITNAYGGPNLLFGSGIMQADANGAGNVALKINGSAGQTADLLDLNVNGTKLTYFDSAGVLRATGGDTGITGSGFYAGANPAIGTSGLVRIYVGASNTMTLGQGVFVGTTVTGAVPFAANSPTGQTADLALLQVNSVNKARITSAGKLCTSEAAGAATQGVATLVGGTVTVATTAVTATSRILISRHTSGGVLGNLSVGAVTAGTSFVISSSSAAETSTVDWIMFDPA